MRLLLAGGTGFLGSALAGAMENVGFEVLSVSRGVQGTSRDSTWVRGDITERESLRRLLDGCDVVVNAAARTGSPGPAENEMDFSRVNCEAAGALAKMAREAGVKVFLQISSTGVFGPGIGEYDEESPCSPATPYERSKLAGEKAVLAEASRTMSTIVVRPSNVFGERHPWNKLLTWMRSAKKERVLLISPREQHWVNYIYVGDVAHVVAQIVERSAAHVDGAVSTTYIINTPVTTEEFFDTTMLALREFPLRKALLIPKLPVTSLAVFLDIVGSICGKRFPLTREKVEELSNRQIFSNSMLKEKFPGFPHFGLYEGLARTATYYRVKGLL